MRPAYLRAEWRYYVKRQKVPETDLCINIAGAAGGSEPFTVPHHPSAHTKEVFPAFTSDQIHPHAGEGHSALFHLNGSTKSLMHRDIIFRLYIS